MDPQVTRVVLWSTTHVRPGREPVTRLLPSWQAVLEDLAREFPGDHGRWTARQRRWGREESLAAWVEDFRPERYGAVWHAEEHIVEL